MNDLNSRKIIFKFIKAVFDSTQHTCAKRPLSIRQSGAKCTGKPFDCSTLNVAMDNTREMEGSGDNTVAQYALNEWMNEQQK